MLHGRSRGYDIEKGVEMWKLEIEKHSFFFFLGGGGSVSTALVHDCSKERCKAQNVSTSCQWL